MKKSFILFSGLLFTTSMAFAQGIGIGIKGGANFANQSVTSISTQSITDWHLGAYVNLNISDKWGITPEILYTAQGSSWDNVDVETDYFAVPVMLRYKPISLISLQAGPQFSFLASASKEDSPSFEDQVKKNDFGLAVGAGLHLPLGINAGVRYVWGFTNISEVSTTEVKNKIFQVYAGWTIFGQK